MIVHKKHIREELRGLSRKHKWIVTDATGMQIHGSDAGWSGGSRSFFHMLDASNARQVEYDLPTLKTWAGGAGALSADVSIPEGCVMHKGGTFCGKPAAPHLYGRLKDILTPEALIELADEIRAHV